MVTHGFVEVAPEPRFNAQTLKFQRTRIQKALKKPKFDHLKLESQAQKP